MTHRNGSDPVLECPKCGKPMSFGTRAKVQVHFEQGNIYNLKSVSRMACRECAVKTASEYGIEVDDV